MDNSYTFLTNLAPQNGLSTINGAGNTAHTAQCGMPYDGMADMPYDDMHYDGMTYNSMARGDMGYNDISYGDTAYDGMMRGGMTQNDMPQPDASLLSPLFTAGFLNTQIGKLMRVEFLVGDTMNDRVGRLVRVGSSFILLQAIDQNTTIMCDLHSIKFVTIVNENGNNIGLIP